MARFDLLQGTLDMLILRVLDRGQMHGWSIAQRKREIPRTLFCGGLFIAVMLGLSACTTKRTASGEHIYFTGTSAYDRKLRTLDLTVQQAKDRVADYLRVHRADSRPIFIGDHIVIVGDCFVFSLPQKADVSLMGYYVDGHTGEVRERREGYVSLPVVRK